MIRLHNLELEILVKLQTARIEPNTSYVVSPSNSISSFSLSLSLSLSLSQAGIQEAINIRHHRNAAAHLLKASIAAWLPTDDVHIDAVLIKSLKIKSVAEGLEQVTTNA